MKKPIQTIFLMKIPRQTKSAYDPDFASFKTLVRLCARSKTLMKRLVQTKMRYDTLDHSIYEKTQNDQKSL